MKPRTWNHSIFFSILVAAAGCDVGVELEAPASDGATSAFAADADEPPTNPFLADSAWPMSHRNPYNQASSPLPGPTAADAVSVEDVAALPGIITLAFGPTGDIWAKSIASVSVLTAGESALAIADSESIEASAGEGLSGAYTVVDRDGAFFTPSGNAILAYRPGEGLGAPDRLVLGPEHLGAAADVIVGFNLTYDGMLAFATAQGVVGVAARDFSTVQTISLGAGEIISNSIATDENRFIYVVTSERMVRVAWTGTRLSLDAADGAWTAAYETGPDDPATGRLGPGSGSTPSLMGTGDQDKFVVITDGQELMHLVLFWRDEIPADWEPIAPGVDRRIAAQVPVRFGDDAATTSVSEQSVLVRGYSAMVVNNDYGLDQPASWPEWLNRLNVIITNWPGIAPYGAEKLTWDPATRTLASVWANPNISCPNGIPTMSADAGLAYCIGQRWGVWTLEGIDWATGASAFHHYLGVLPRYNSAYAATEVGPDRDILTGTFTGVVRIRP